MMKNRRSNMMKINKMKKQMKRNMIALVRILMNTMRKEIMINAQMMINHATKKLIYLKKSL